MFGYKREKTREFGENCITTGFVIRQILLEEMRWVGQWRWRRREIVHSDFFVVPDGRKLI
jgi:hypothetical protein